jgi:hypothetical protein
MFIIIQVHCQIPYEHADWPAHGWTQTDGRDGKCWMFENEVEAQELADYMNSPHYNYASWKYCCEWDWVTMPLAQFEELVPNKKDFVAVPDIKAQLHADILRAEQTSMDALREAYLTSLDPKMAAETRICCDDGTSRDVKSLRKCVSTFQYRPI